MEDRRPTTRRPISRRSVLRRLGTLAAASTASAAFPLDWARAEDAPKRRVLFFTKSSGFEHSVIKRKGNELGHAEKVLVELGKEHGFEVEPTKDGTVFDGDLSRYDAFFFYTTGDLTQAGTDKTPPMSAKGKEALLEAIRSGKGFVGSHWATDSFHTPGDRFKNQETPDPYVAMIGGEFIRHGPQQKSTMRVAGVKFPGFDGVKDFELHEEWYSLKNFAPDLCVLLVQETAGMNGKDYQRPPYPATWARSHEKGRVFYTSMGHREDVWTNPTFQKIILGGLSWACGNASAELERNLRKATPEASTMPPE
jgi:hypothetical protein